MQLPDAVLFDLDGTLVDSEPAWARTKAAVALRHGAAWDDADAAWADGKPTPAYSGRIASRAVTGASAEDVAEEISAGMATAMATGRLWRTGALDAIAHLRRLGVRTALVTMSYRAIVDGLLGSAETVLFDAVIAGDDVSRPKPDPEGYLRAVDALGTTTGRSIVVEDSATGVQSARAAGIRTIAVGGNVSVEFGGAAEGVTAVSSLTSPEFWDALGVASPFAG